MPPDFRLIVIRLHGKSSFSLTSRSLILLKHFYQIYEKYSQLVYNLALQYTQNQQDAEEITQDVFVSVHQNIDDFRAESQLETWIYRIGINKSLDFLKAKRSKKRRFFFNKVQLDDEKQPLQLPNFDHPGVLLEQKEDLTALFGAINQLKDQQKTIIILLKIEGKSQKEVAAILDITTKAVESLFQRAKKNLLIFLNKQKENEI